MYFTSFSQPFIYLTVLVLVLGGVPKHVEVGGDPVEELEQGLLRQLVQVSRLEAASTLWTPVLPRQFQGRPLVFTHSQTVMGRSGQFDEADVWHLWSK